ncbi:MAG: heme exporter protein CcmD [Alphaproteobacteria bacterium]
MDATLDFLAMGGYAAYVWPAFGAAAAVLIGLWAASHRALALNRRRLGALEADRRSGNPQP